MARIRMIRETPSLVVVVEGRLGAADMRRLEHACAPALISARPELEVDIRRVTEIDPVAEALLAHIAGRGAVIRKRD